MLGTMVQTLCIFCGSSPGFNGVYAQQAKLLGKEMAAAGISLIYGGGRAGLMGAIADSVLASGGTAIGVIPTFLVEKEVAHTSLSELVVVESMHQRKAKMSELADGFIMMPGGFGTFEEFIEILTWSMLGFHSKPCGVLNVNGYYDRMLDMFAHASVEGFLHDRHRTMIIVESDPKALIKRMAEYKHATAPKFSEENAEKLT